MPARTAPPVRQRCPSTAVGSGGRVGARGDWWDDPGDDLDLHPTSALTPRSQHVPGAAVALQIASAGHLF